MNYFKLAQNFAKDINVQAAQDRSYEEAYYRNDGSLHETHVDTLKRVIAEELAKENADIQGTLPVASVFEAYQVAKKASEEFSRDVGVIALVGHLQTKWKRDKTANMNASDFYKLKEYYKFNYPKSAASDIMEDIAKKGYATLETSKLMEIASQIECQDDYEYQIRANHLTANSISNKKARQFILALVNGEDSIGQGSAPEDRYINNIEFYWDEDSNPDDVGWVWVSKDGDARAVPGNEGRDPNITDEDLYEAFFQDPASSFMPGITGTREGENRSPFRREAQSGILGPPEEKPGAQQYFQEDFHSFDGFLEAIEQTNDGFLSWLEIPPTQEEFDAVLSILSDVGYSQESSKIKEVVPENYEKWIYGDVYSSPEMAVLVEYGQSLQPMAAGMREAVEDVFGEYFDKGASKKAQEGYGEDDYETYESSNPSKMSDDELYEEIRALGPKKLYQMEMNQDFPTLTYPNFMEVFEKVMSDEEWYELFQDWMEEAEGDPVNTEMDTGQEYGNPGVPSDAAW